MFVHDPSDVRGMVSDCQNEPSEEKERGVDEEKKEKRRKGSIVITSHFF